MKVRLISLVLLSLGLLGCASTQPVYNSDIIEISNVELRKYWIFQPKIYLRRGVSSKHKSNFRSKGGEWTYSTVIDSNGIEQERILVSSKPEGYMTQFQLDKMPRKTYEPSSGNPQRVPVKFISSSQIDGKKR